jgi:hypothetical protein
LIAAASVGKAATCTEKPGDVLPDDEGVVTVRGGAGVAAGGTVAVEAAVTGGVTG